MCWLSSKTNYYYYVREYKFFSVRMTQKSKIRCIFENYTYGYVEIRWIGKIDTSAYVLQYNIFVCTSSSVKNYISKRIKCHLEWYVYYVYEWKIRDVYNRRIRGRHLYNIIVISNNISSIMCLRLLLFIFFFFLFTFDVYVQWTIAVS